MRELDIEIPQVGELLDIVYVQTVYIKGSVKSSQKMHLLKYAQRKGLGLNLEEYIAMFRTSTTRISLCAFLPSNIDEVENGMF